MTKKFLIIITKEILQKFKKVRSWKYVHASSAVNAASGTSTPQPPLPQVAVAPHEAMGKVVVGPTEPVVVNVASGSLTRHSLGGHHAPRHPTPRPRPRRWQRAAGAGAWRDDG